MKPFLTRRVLALPFAGVFLFLAAGCQSSGGRGAGSSVPTDRVLTGVPGVQRIVEEYLRAATVGDGAKMYALIATSERDDESPETLGDTARDRYSPTTKWEVLKAEETGSTG